MNASDKNARKLFPEPNKDDRSTPAHRQLIGSVGLVLPILLWVIAGWRTRGEHPWIPLGSISAYYYSGAVSVFAGMLIALALFLFAYQGYANKYYLRDRVAAIIAGCAAVVVALYPTTAPSDSLALSWWTPLTGKIHLGAAAVLFGCFIFFASFQFPISITQKGKPLPRDKMLRNGFYYFCGLAMVVCIIWVIYALSTGARIFLPEALALEFFALSWLVKGGVHETAVEVGRRGLYYGRHPRQMVKEAWNAVRVEQSEGTKAPQNDG